jgi:hypothetical protein
VLEVLEHFSSQQEPPPKVETRRPQDQFCITGPEAITKTGTQGVIIQPQRTFTSSQDARTQDAPEAMVKKSSHQQMLEQMFLPKEATGGSQDTGYNNAPEAMVQFGQTSSPPQSLAISLFAQDARNQDAPEAMPQIDGRNMTAESFWTVS